MSLWPVIGFSDSASISSNGKQSVLSNISINAVELLNRYDNFFIYYEHIGEPDFNSDILKKIYDECVNIELDINNILIVNGTNSNNLINLDFKEKYGVESNMRLLTYNWPIPFKALEIRSVRGIEPNKDSEKSTIADISHIHLKKSKKALFLNRRLRYHRLLSLCLLENLNLLDNMLYSFDLSQNMYDNLSDMILDDVTHHNPIYITDEINKDKILNGFSSLQRKKKSILDFDDLSSVHGYGMETKELYEQTFFSIVSETEFNLFTQSFTEKIMKPIQHCHPFVLIGSPYILKTLKRYGFKTFSNWWDESYDNIEDNETRLINVIDLIESLTNKSDDEWNTMLLYMEDTLLHNQNILLSYGEDKLNNILLKNIKRAIKYNGNTIL
jgi:hypothetical protein